MIERLQTLLSKISDTLRASFALRALCYALMAAAIFLVWLLSDGESVAFVYSEF